MANVKSDELNPNIKIKSPLRCDGIGRLDCAEDTDSGARLAVRWLPLDANGDAAARACAKLPDHPTLPRIRQTGTVGDKAFVALDFPDGKLLATLLGETVSGELLLEAGAQLADALATIHAQSVFHGELSAESVLLAKGKAYLWDMPLVIANRMTDRRGEERLMHQLVRTAPFLPPERARGALPSAEGDVYSLAAVMCLAGGATPAPAGSTLSLVHLIANGGWGPEVPAVFHEPFRGLLTRMLAKEPGLRPTAREVADLLGKPAGAIPTIPEMPAVVLPKDFVLPKVPVPPAPVGAAARPAPKTPFAAAPGALEPMLPSKAVADAAVKSAAANHKPLAITVPTAVEPTVKVSVPVQVLVAMSQPVPVDSEIKAALAAVAEARATKTLEFGAVPPPAVTPPTPSVPLPVLQTNHIAKEKTPPPALAPTAAQVKDALAPAAKEKTPAPAAAPTAAQVKDALEVPQAAVTAPNPPPMPRKTASREMTPLPGSLPPVTPEVLAAAAVIELPVQAPANGAVELNDNVTVSAETYAAGAAALSEEEADALEMLPRSKPTWLIAAALLAVLTLGLGLGARAMTAQAAVKPLTAVVLPKALPAPKPAAVAAPIDQDDELLAPLPLGVKETKPRAMRIIRKAQPASPAKIELKGDKGEMESPAPAPDDFSFLGTGYEAPKEELKRPSF